MAQTVVTVTDRSLQRIKIQKQPATVLSGVRFLTGGSKLLFTKKLFVMKIENTSNLMYFGKIKINIEWHSLYTDGVNYYIKRYNVFSANKWKSITSEEVGNFCVTPA